MCFGMQKPIEINGKKIGIGFPVYVIAEIGINHNGDIDIAKKLIDVAAQSGCDAVKFQKRTPEICVPEEQKSIPRETPWGTMSSLEEIDKAVKILADVPLAIAQSTSTYPCENNELNLRAIATLGNRYGIPAGYSGHERGVQATIAAVALGATFIERHITLDRSMWGTDHSASLEPAGLERLVRDIRIVELALGDGAKRVYDSEIPIRAKLRRVI